MKKLFLVISAVVVTVIAIFLVVGREGNNSSVNSEPAGSESEQAQQYQSELIIGSLDAPATIIAYEDFKCPTCNQFHQNAERQIREDYVNSGKLKIIFRPYPVYNEDAGEALYGAYCANDQGKFTAYHDELFDFMWGKYYKSGNYSAALKNIFTKEVLAAEAVKVGIDREKFSACLAGDTHNSKFERALRQAASDEIQGTPSFIINSQKIVGSQPYSVFKTLVDIQLR
ncbi:DsbA family protein [Candidatus Saccharibacteria bacterium]|nr:DsbA family protein [Candidatus Saccharibacteria bacterium]